MNAVRIAVKRFVFAVSFLLSRPLCSTFKSRQLNPAIANGPNLPSLGLQTVRVAFPIAKRHSVPALPTTGLVLFTAAVIAAGVALHATRRVRFR